MPSTIVTTPSSNDLMDMEEQLKHQMARLADYYRHRADKNAKLHIEAQFWRRMREYCNRNIGDIEECLINPELYCRD